MFRQFAIFFSDRHIVFVLLFDCSALSLLFAGSGVNAIHQANEKFQFESPKIGRQFQKLDLVSTK